MDLISVLAAVILITSIGTLVVGIAAYGAFKIRDLRTPARRVLGEDEEGVIEPVFFQRFTLGVAAPTVYTEQHRIK